MVVQILNLQLNAGNGSTGTFHFKRNNLYTLKGQSGAVGSVGVPAVFGLTDVTVMIATDSSGQPMTAPHHLAVIPCPPHCGGGQVEMLTLEEFIEEFARLQ